MNLATVFSRAKSGITAPTVRVEVHISNGLPALNIVGLPETVSAHNKVLLWATGLRGFQPNKVFSARLS